MPDVVVVGGGLAGCWAAATAAQAGARVTLVRRALGATAVSAGPVDFVPPAEAADPAGWLARLPRADPHHPYVTAGVAPTLDDLDAEAARLGRALGQQGVPMHVALRTTPLLLAAVTGQVRPAGVAPSLQAAGNLNRLTGRTVAVAGIAGMAGFDPGAVAAALEERRLGWPAPLQAIALQLNPELPGVPPEVAADLDDATLARALEAPGGAEALGAAIAAALRPGAAELVLLPAVLGLDDPDEVADRVSTTAGLPVAELLTSPPSAPGWRLQRACEQAAETAGVSLVSGSVQGVQLDAEGGRATAVNLGGGADPIACDAVVLATGKYLGGGVAADPRPREALLGLPLFSRGTPVERLALRDLVERAHFRDQPFAGLGVRTDGHGRPLDEHGQPTHANVLACGDLLAGLDPTLSGGGLGVVAWTAARAGRAAATLAGASPSAAEPASPATA